MKEKRPLWFLLVVIVTMLPAAAYPTLLGLWSQADGAEMKLLLTFYPVYVVASGVFAYICWPARKPEAWILIVLMLLSHAAMWGLVLR